MLTIIATAAVTTHSNTITNAEKSADSNFLRSVLENVHYHHTLDGTGRFHVGHIEQSVGDQAETIAHVPGDPTTESGETRLSWAVNGDSTIVGVAYGHPVTLGRIAADGTPQVWAGQDGDGGVDALGGPPDGDLVAADEPDGDRSGPTVTATTLGKSPSGVRIELGEPAPNGTGLFCTIGWCGPHYMNPTVTGRIPVNAVGGGDTLSDKDPDTVWAPPANTAATWDLGPSIRLVDAGVWVRGTPKSRWEALGSSDGHRWTSISGGRDGEATISGDSGPHRYLKVVVHSGALVEVEWFGAVEDYGGGPQNLLWRGGDTRGFITTLGTNWGRRPFQNPTTTTPHGVTLYASPTATTLTDKDPATVWQSQTEDDQVTWDFGAGRELQIRTLRITSGYNPDAHPRNFKVEGSADGTTWFVLRSFDSDYTVAETGRSYTWWIDPHTPIRHLQLRTQGPVEIAELELWGNLTDPHR